MEILFSEIGAPSPEAEPAAAVEAGPAGGAQGAPTATRGGTSYGDAPVLGAGSWKDTIRSGETLYYRVPVGWGQSLAANLRFNLIAPGKGAMQPIVEIHDALRNDPLNRQIAQLSGGGAKTVTIETPAVQGPAQEADPVVPFRIGGDEYLVVNGSGLFGLSDTAAAAMRIDLAVNGEQVEGPRLDVVGANTSPSPTAEESSPPPSKDASDPVAGDDDSGGIPGWLLGVAGVLLLAVVVGLALAARRRSSGTSAPSST